MKGSLNQHRRAALSVCFSWVFLKGHHKLINQGYRMDMNSTIKLNASDHFICCISKEDLCEEKKNKQDKQ